MQVKFYDDVEVERRAFSSSRMVKARSLFERILAVPIPVATQHINLRRVGVIFHCCCQAFIRQTFLYSHITNRVAVKLSDNIICKGKCNSGLAVTFANEGIQKNCIYFSKSKQAHL